MAEDDECSSLVVPATKEVPSVHSGYLRGPAAGGLSSADNSSSRANLVQELDDRVHVSLSLSARSKRTETLCYMSPLCMTLELPKVTWCIVFGSLGIAWRERGGEEERKRDGKNERAEGSAEKNAWPHTDTWYAPRACTETCVACAASVERKFRNDCTDRA